MELLLGRDIEIMVAKLRGEDPVDLNGRITPGILNGARSILEYLGEEDFFERLPLFAEIYCLTPEEHVEFLGRRDTHYLWSPEKQELTLQEPELSEKMGKLEGVMMFSNNERASEVASREYELLSYLCGRAEIIEYVD